MYLYICIYIYVYIYMYIYIYMHIYLYIYKCILSFHHHMLLLEDPWNNWYTHIRMYEYVSMHVHIKNEIKKHFIIFFIHFFEV
jgi:hypothetical protein